jgi:hypothetical protein
MASRRVNSEEAATYECRCRRNTLLFLQCVGCAWPLRRDALLSILAAMRYVDRGPKR